MNHLGKKEGSAWKIKNFGNNHPTLHIKKRKRVGREKILERLRITKDYCDRDSYHKKKKWVRDSGPHRECGKESTNESVEKK